MSTKCRDKVLPHHKQRNISLELEYPVDYFINIITEPNELGVAKNE